jgi:hypothetical protein
MEWGYDNLQKEKRYFKVNEGRLICLKALAYAQYRLSKKEGLIIIRL